MGATDRHPFWSLQCPAREPLRVHMRSGTTPEVCFFCGAIEGTLVMPPVDVEARLKALGYLNGHVTDPNDDDAPREPKMITGLGPQGSQWRVGRSRDGKGSLSEADEHALTFYVERLRPSAKLEP